jgi:putative hydrolase of the HAD superfamily
MVSLFSHGIVFDLDDTLYSEEDFVLSAYRHISAELSRETGLEHFTEMCEFRRNGLNPLDAILERYRVSIDIKTLVDLYRFHLPTIELRDGAKWLLDQIKRKEIPLGLVTDGRSRTQRNKLTGLGIDGYFDSIVISEEFGLEKPSVANFLEFSKRFSCLTYWYVGDNWAKDFFGPNQLGWNSVCLVDDGRNIHKKPASISEEFHPKYSISKLNELIALLA